MSLTGPAITREKAKKDVVLYLNSLGFDVEEVHKCSANIEYMDGYSTYFYSHEFETVKALISSFINKHKHELPGPKPKMYVWFKVEGTYRYLNIGLFTRGDDGLTRLHKLVFGVPLH